MVFSSFGVPSSLVKSHRMLLRPSSGQLALQVVKLEEDGVDQVAAVADQAGVCLSQ